MIRDAPDEQGQAAQHDQGSKQHISLPSSIGMQHEVAKTARGPHPFTNHRTNWRH